MKKILLVGGYPAGAVTGLSSAVGLLVSGLKRLRISHELLVKRAVDPHTRQGAFNLARSVEAAGFIFSAWKKLMTCRTIYITIALTPFGFVRDAMLIWPARLFGRRIILHLHGGGYGFFYSRQKGWFRRIIRCTLGAVNAIVVLGESLRGQFDFLNGAATKLRVVPNSLPSGLKVNFSAHKNLPDRDPLRLLYLSNMMRSKGYIDVLAACRKLKREMNIPFRCDFCGEFIRTSVDEEACSPEESRKNFLKLINEWNLKDNAFYHGVAAGKFKEELLGKAHFLLLPTSYPWEGQPISIIEALAFGTPVIATAHRGIKEQVIPGFNGFFVAPGAPDEIADTIRRISGDGDLYRRLSENARKHFLQNFTREIHLQRLIGILLEQAAR